MQYPLDLRFKLLALGNRISATDASGNLLLFISQKMFKLKEQIEVFGDTERTRLLFNIKADRMLDFSANYHFTDAMGNDWGRITRRGMRSLWAAHYDVLQNEQIDMTIEEESPMKKVIESVLSEIPLLGSIATYLINPSYIVRRPDGTQLLRIIKKPAIFEGHFVVQKLNDMPEDDEMRSLLAMITMVLLEKKRG